MEASVARQFAGARAVVVLLAYDYVALSTIRQAVAVLNALLPPAQNDGLIGRIRPYFGPHT